MGQGRNGGKGLRARYEECEESGGKKVIWELSDLMEIKEASVAGPQRRSSRISVEGWLGRTLPCFSWPHCCDPSLLSWPPPSQYPSSFF